MTTIERPPARSRATRFWEGAHTWGFSEATSSLYAARTGVDARRLVVYPPGTSPAERRALVLRRRWPSWGGFLALLVALLAAPSSAVAALIAMTVVYATGFAVAVLATRRVWSARRELRCSTVRVGEFHEEYGDAHALEQALATLLALERSRAEGRIDEVGYELGWGRVYEAADAQLHALD